MGHPRADVSVPAGTCCPFNTCVCSRDQPLTSQSSVVLLALLLLLVCIFKSFLPPAVRLSIMQSRSIELGRQSYHVCGCCINTCRSVLLAWPLSAFSIAYSLSFCRYQASTLRSLSGNSTTPKIDWHHLRACFRVFRSPA